MITVKDIAEKAGISFSTVAAALRDSPRVSMATKEKVLRVAQEMGYRRNPFASGLAKARREEMASYQATLAFLDIHRIPGTMRNSRRIMGFLKGASERGAMLGYSIEVFRVFEPHLTGRRLSDILLARGIEGVILYGTPKDTAEIMGWPLEWDHFAVAVAGESLLEHPFHYAFNDAFKSTMVAIQKVQEAGYTRIGIMDSTGNKIDSVANRVEAALLLQTRFFPAKERIPLMHLKLFPEKVNPSLFLEQQTIFEKWFLKHRPQVLLTRARDHAVKWLKNMGLSIPRDIGLVDLALDPQNKQFAGVEECTEEMGAAALDLVVNDLISGKRGFPKVQRGVLIQGIWHSGASLLEKVSPRASQKK